MTSTFVSSPSEAQPATSEFPLVIAFCILGLFGSAALFLSQPLLALETLAF